LTEYGRESSASTKVIKQVSTQRVKNSQQFGENDGSSVFAYCALLNLFSFSLVPVKMKKRK
jgi:hypothetical protein